MEKQEWRKRRYAITGAAISDRYIQVRLKEYVHKVCHPECSAPTGSTLVVKQSRRVRLYLTQYRGIELWNNEKSHSGNRYGSRK